MLFVDPGPWRGDGAQSSHGIVGAHGVVQDCGPGTREACRDPVRGQAALWRGGMGSKHALALIVS